MLAKFKRLCFWLLVLFALIAIVLALSLWFYSRASQPTINGQLSLAGLSGPARVVRDANAVAHIQAASIQDAQFLLGYVHAQERLWQMQVNRHIAAGRLAELVGSPGVETDRFLRTIGIGRAAQQIAQSLDAPTRQILQSYAQGVNAYLQTSNQALPAEFHILRLPKPEPWAIEDSIGWTLMMAWDLSGNWSSELTRLRLAQKGWSLEMINQFLPPYPGTQSPTTADYTKQLKTMIAQTETLNHQQLAKFARDEGLGSNNWVVSGAHTVSGKPLLANDPHLGLQAPALWYFAHLQAPGLDVIGATLPGTPGVVLGRNQHIAWGFTNTAPDTQDLYFEKLNPANPNQVLGPNGPNDWRDLQIITEMIKVKGGVDVALTIRRTRHGPIISEGASGSATKNVPKGYAISFAWTALSESNSTISATMRMNRATNWGEFADSVKYWASPQQNMVYADKQGNIGFIAPGNIPVRKKEHDLQGLFPAPGWDAKYDWDGYIPFDQLPKQYNPANGMRWTANERIVEPDYPHHITHEWAVPYRANRIAQLLKATPKHSMNSFATMQADTVSLAVQELLPLLKAINPQGRSNDEQAALKLLSAWDGNMAVDQPAPLLYMLWIRQVTQRLYADELGDLFNDLWDQRQQFIANTLLQRAGAGAWCDNISTPTVETCTQQVEAAFVQAVQDYMRQCPYGLVNPSSASNKHQCQWGQAHTARSEHRPFSKVAALAQWFDVVNPVPGDTYTVNVNRYHLRNASEPFVSKHAASLRALYDLSDLEKSQFMHSTGQSGNILSKYYRDYAQQWASVKYVPMQTDPRNYESGALGTLTIQPSQ